MNLVVCRLFKFVTWLTLTLASSVSCAQDEFSDFLEGLLLEAVESGISDETANDAINRIQFLPDVIAMDRSQPEFISPFLDYFKKRVDITKVQKGRKMLMEHEAIFNKIEAQYGVPKYTLAAFWGMETHYGRMQGSLDVLSSLATLAYDGRRTDFFRAQLLDAIRMIDIGHVAAGSLTGSWAGAFGNMQFMPTTFMLYAVDGDGDNVIDVVDSLPDAFASAANYLSQVGWRDNEPVMLEVQLADDFDWKTAQLPVRKSIEDWSRLGVRVLCATPSFPDVGSKELKKIDSSSKKANLQPTKVRKIVLNNAAKTEQKYPSETHNSTMSLDDLGLKLRGPAAILLPQGYRGPAFMVFDNFDVIMDWNRSVNYALSVAQLAEQLKRDSKIAGGQFAESGALSFQEMLDLQTILNARGFDAGEPDGLPGLMTQEAVRKYQLANQLPADGYASRSVYERLYSERQE